MRVREEEQEEVQRIPSRWVCGVCGEVWDLQGNMMYKGKSESFHIIFETSNLQSMGSWMGQHLGLFMTDIVWGVGFCSRNSWKSSQMLVEAGKERETCLGRSISRQRCWNGGFSFIGSMGCVPHGGEEALFPSSFTSQWLVKARPEGGKSPGTPGSLTLRQSCYSGWGESSRASLRCKLRQRPRKDVKGYIERYKKI